MVAPLTIRPLRRMALAGLGALALALGCGLLSLWVQGRTPTNQLASARERWRVSAPARYRLVAEAGARCVLDVDVSGERVVAVHRRDGCSPPAHTVTELFHMLDTVRVVSYPCVAFNCACRTEMGISTAFDGALGFPRSISLWSRRAPNLERLGYWQYMLTHIAPPPCGDRSSEALIVRVVSLTPLP